MVLGITFFVYLLGRFFKRCDVTLAVHATPDYTAISTVNFIVIVAGPVRISTAAGLMSERSLIPLHSPSVMTR